MFNSTIKKRIQVLGILFLILGTFTTVFNFYQMNLTLNDTISNEEVNNKSDPDLEDLKSADYSSSYARTGGSLDITLHQSLVNTTEAEFSNIDTANILKEACPISNNFNSSYTNIIIEEIYAPNKSIIIEDNTAGNGFESYFLGEYYTSFNTRGYGFLENISIPIKLVTPGSYANITIKLYNARNDGSGTPEPDSNLGLIVPKTNISLSSYYWHNFTNIHAEFNSSETYANTFFLRVEKVDGGAVYWDWYSDGSDADESFVYNGALILETFGLNTIDLGLKVAFAPEDHTPKPEGINFNINSTAVTGDLIIDNKGSWTSYGEYQNPSGILDFALSTDWWDVSCNVTNVQINYTKTDLEATSLLNIPGTGQSVDWNCTLGLVDNFDTRFSNYEINFTVPATWENFSAFNDPIDKTSDISLGSMSNNYRELQILNADNGTNWYLTAQSVNLLDTVHTYVSAVELSTMDFTDTISFLANFSKIVSNGGINLTVWSPSLSLSHNYYNDSFISGTEVSLETWDISDTATEYGLYKVQASWKNDTEGGFFEKDINIMGVTDLVLISPALGLDRFLNDIFNITVFFNDTGLNLGDQGISGATINTNTTTLWFDEGNGYYNIEVDCNEIDYNYGWNYIGINASKTNYNSAPKTFSFHFREHTTISPSNTKDFGDVIRGSVVLYEFNYSEISGSPITGADRNVMQVDPGFGAPIFSEIVNGNYSIQLDTNNVQASAIPYECIFNITDTGKETQIITIYLTIILSQTDIDIESSVPLIIKKDGLNQTILFYFNDTDNNKAITGLPASDVRVTDNQTSLPRNIWLYPNGTDGYYILNVSVANLNSGWIELMINVTFEPNYATSLESVIFYLQGNFTQTNIISISDPGGEGILTGVGNDYTCFIGRDLDIDFNITDTDNGNALVTGTAKSYLVEYIEIGNPTNQGAIGQSLNNATTSYQGTIDTSSITVVGSYEITVKVFKTDFERSTVHFNLTIRALYIINISVVDKPKHITAGDSFHIIVQVKFNNGSWNLVVGSNVRFIPSFDGITGTPSSWTPTNTSGEVEFEILTSNTIRNITLLIEVQSAYYHEGDTKEVYDIVVHAPSTGLTFEDLLPYIIIGAIAAAAIGGSVGIYRGVVVPKKREKTRILTEVKTIFDDAINLEHILVLYKGTGTCIYFKSFGSEQIDPELISGFISAISSFGKDLVSQEELNEISYGDKMLLLSDGEYIRVALVLGKKASLILRRNLMEFIHSFERNYTSDLPNWRGQLNLFRNAGTIVDEVLNTSIILPHEITYEHSTAKALKKPHSRDVLKITKNLMKDSERNFFFIATLLKEATEKTGKDTAEIFMGIKELRDTKILMPIEIAAIEAKPISQQELNLINQKVATLVSLSPEEKQKLVSDLAQMGPAEREAYFASLTEHHKIVSAPVEVKPGATVIDNVKAAKKEIKNLKKNALLARKEKDYDNTIKNLQNALKVGTAWELVKESQDLDDLVRMVKIEDLKNKMKTLEKEARLAAKEKNYNEASQKYRMSSKIASEIFKLGEDLTKEVKRLSNKAKEYEKLV